MSVIHRVDKFAVPEAALEEFWGHVRRTHAVLRRQPGFLDDMLLEQCSGPGRFNVVTLVRWSSAEDLPGARLAVARAHAEAAFHPEAYFRRAGIQADLGNYAAVGA